MLRDGVTLYFIRHGETDWNKELRYQGQTDIPVNDTGRAQAERNGKVLRELLGATAGIMGFAASPLLRTVETMLIVRRQLSLPPEPFVRDDRLKEQHFGHWEGVLYSELPKVDPQGFAARQADMWNWQPKGGENYEMVRSRVAAWLSEVVSDSIVVSHGNVGRALRGILLDLDTNAVPRLEVPQDKVLMVGNGRSAWL